MRPAVVLVLIVPAAADWWGPYGEHEWTSAGGRYRLTGRDDNGFAFRLFDRDRLLTEGTVPQLPLGVHVLGGGAGAVLFEKYAAIGHGDAVSLLGPDGKLRWRLSLRQLFPRGAGGWRSMSSIHWHRAWWVDEPRGKVVLVAARGLAEVDLQTGERVTPDTSVVLAAFDLPWARERALEVAVELEPQGLRDAAEKLLRDESPGTRLRAAVAVEKAGGARVTREVWDAALAQNVPTATRRAALAFAGRHVADVQLVQGAARQHDLAEAAVEALGDRGALAALDAIADDEAVDPAIRTYAAATAVNARR